MSKSPISKPVIIRVQPPPVRAFTMAEAGPLPDGLDSAEYQPIAFADPELVTFPIMHGWPIALPGSVISSPTVADIDGDGKAEILANCGFLSDHKLVNSNVNQIPLMFAFHADGSLVDGYPIRLNSRSQPDGDGYPWATSPSVVRGAEGFDYVVNKGPHSSYVFIIDPKKRLFWRVWGCDGASNVPLVDLDRNGIPDMASSKLMQSLNASEVNTWPKSRWLRNGYSPCIGNARGDGELSLYHLFYKDKTTGLYPIVGFDYRGTPLAGWPQQVRDASPTGAVMGDVSGDEAMEVIANSGEGLHVWNADGTNAPGTTSDGPVTGLLRADVMQNAASPSLADLDGDGKAEIVVFDNESKSIRVFHGGGKPFLRDGVIATLPTSANGVTVVSLGDDPKIFDFFAGTFWVRQLSDGTTTVTNMLPKLSATYWSQPTIADVNNDGLADAVFGLADGRLFDYETKLAFHANRAQWPTANGNFQHTGAWEPK